MLYAPTRGSSVKDQQKYRIRTTPLPADPAGIDWRGYFNDRLKQPPVTAYHDGNEITAYCDPEKHPDWLEKVDAAIEQTNEYWSE